MSTCAHARMTLENKIVVTHAKEPNSFANHIILHVLFEIIQINFHKTADIFIF